MLGAIAGDIIGSIYEWDNIKTEDFPLFSSNCRFTDDTVLTVAVADAIINNAPYGEKLQHYFSLYPQAGYGASFQRWAASKNRQPYNSWGNGSAMRVSPVGHAFDDLPTVMEEAEKSAAATHNHPEGIKGAQAVAAAIFLARNNRSQEEIRAHIEEKFSYRLDVSLCDIRKDYCFDVSCQGSVPQAITAFLESHSFEDAVRKAVSIGGDSDTIACIAGAIAEPFYGGVPEIIRDKVIAILDSPLLAVTLQFRERFGLT